MAESEAVKMMYVYITLYYIEVIYSKNCYTTKCANKRQSMSMRE